MLLPDTAERDAEGRLRIGGCDVAALGHQYQTPLYLFDEATLRGRLRAYRDAVRAAPAGGDVLYGAKAYLSPAMVRLLVEEDCGVDVVSGGELEIALRGGMSPERIGFPGNNKDAHEVHAAWDAGIGHLVVDSLHELELARALPSSRRLSALLRVSPGVKPDTHDYISTGQLDSKFGFPIETGAALEALRTALAVPTLEVRGLHMHIGSQIFELGSYAAALNEVAAFAATVRAELDFDTAVLSAGGGLGIAHTDADHPPTVYEFMTRLIDSLSAAWSRHGLPVPRLLVEPGRSVAGPAGVAVYRVGARKEIRGVRTYLALDGGMADNIRPKLYGAVYQPVAVVARPDAATEVVSLAGRYCESTDILAADVALPHLESGDLVAVPAAGAYTLSMASNYNAALRPAVLFLRDGEARLVRRRETVDDLLRCEVNAEVPGC